MYDTSLPSGPRQETHEFVAFRIAGQTYCIDIMAVREIRGWTQTTVLPHCPNFICGMINLRGVVLPIIDLAARLGFPPAAPTARHAVVVVQVGDQLAGLLVDAVSDIVNVTPDSIQPTPDVGSKESHDLVRGVIAAQDQMISVLAPENLVPEAAAAA